MIKRFITWFLVVTFLNIAISSGPALAGGERSYKGDELDIEEIFDDSEKEMNKRILIGSAITLGVVLVFSLIVKGIVSKPSGLKSETPNQAYANFE